MAQREQGGEDAGSAAGGRTIPALWRRATSERREWPAYLVEREGRWQEVSWNEAGRRVDELAHGLLALGIGKGEPVAVLGATRLEWALLDFALALVGAVTVPIYPVSSARDCAYVLEYSEAVAAIAEDEEQLSKVADARPGLPRLRHVLSFADLDALAARGHEYAVEHPDALAAAEGAVREDDLYTHIYTSGTTGPPKACLITHRNYYVMAATVDQLDGFIRPGDVMLLYLPLAHNFGRLMHLGGPYAGCTIAFCPDPGRVPEALLAVRPTVLPSVPRLYEKIHAAAVARFEETAGPRRRLIGWALRVGREASVLRAEGRPLPPALATRHRLADWLVYSKVKARLGGRLRIAISGGAPLAREIAEFFHALGILVLEGYGLTECTSAATVNRPDRFRFGTVGHPLPGFEARLADDGELLLRSETIFAGYLKDEEATRAVLTDDGWLRTGDLAEIDADGFIRITDRKKDIIITAGGKNIAPQNIENDLKSSRYISQALVVGDRRPYVVALVTLDPEETGRWAAQRGLDQDPAVLAEHPDVVALVREVVEGVNRDRSRFEQIKRFRILRRDFSAGDGEITPTLKLRRRVCEEHFAAEIEALYAGA